VTWTSRRSNSTALVFLLAVVFCATLRAQPSPAMEAARQSQAEVRFDFERPGLPVPKFALDVNEDGAGTYTAEDASSQAKQQIRRDFTLTAATSRKIFALTRAMQLSQEVCASKAKNIADTGKKTLTFTASGATSSCTYNYSENKDVQALTDIFQGIAETMDMGRHLDFLRRFDRLGLNDAIASLAEEVSAGRALEIGTIAPSLRSIVSDADVMQRVRTRATALLAKIPADNAPR
jgi:hypothetical protein